MEKEISRERKGNLNQKCSGGRKYLNRAEMSQEENKVVERKLINYGNEIQELKKRESEVVEAEKQNNKRDHFTSRNTFNSNQ